jgi:uncharacterized delta-60 repeat protein
MMVGELDSSFGIAGNVVTDFGIAGEWASGFTDIAEQQDSKLVAVGGSENTQLTILAARYLQNGTPDLTFANNGVLKLNIGSRQGRVATVAIQTDKKILIGGGGVTTSGSEHFFVIRLLENGELDTSFGNNGITSYQIEDGMVNDITIQADGKILVVGGAGLNINNRTVGMH